MYQKAALILILSLLLGACGSGESIKPAAGKASSPQVERPQPEYLRNLSEGE